MAIGGRLARVLALPASDGAPQGEVGDGAGDDRQPEDEAAVSEHRQQRKLGLDAERDQRADHAAVDPADAAGERQQVGEHADEEGDGQHGGRGRMAEGLEAGP